MTWVGVEMVDLLHGVVVEVTLAVDWLRGLARVNLPTFKSVGWSHKILIGDCSWCSTPKC